jgi:hypothetical protein
MRHSALDPQACSAIDVTACSVSNVNVAPHVRMPEPAPTPFDGIAECQQMALDTGGRARVVTDRGDVERDALVREQTQDRFGWVRFDRVPDRIRQRRPQRVEVRAHPTEIDRQIQCLGHRSHTSGPRCGENLPGDG